MIEGKDYYFIDDGGGKRLVFTKEFLTRRGTCCGSGCLKCPFEPKHTRGVKKIKGQN
jgi:hypothetical protein